LTFIVSTVPQFSLLSRLSQDPLSDAKRRKTRTGLLQAGSGDPCYRRVISGPNIKEFF
jgi:hypothetical protein